MSANNAPFRVSCLNKAEVSDKKDLLNNACQPQNSQCPPEIITMRVIKNKSHFVMLNLFQHLNGILKQVQDDKKLTKWQKEEISRTAWNDADNPLGQSEKKTCHLERERKLPSKHKKVSPHNINSKTNLNKKAAFTMAEVLITLGIIGIIASMTMPQLLGHYQKKVVATRLKRAYNIIARTIERSKVSYGGLS